MSISCSSGLRCSVVVLNGCVNTMCVRRFATSIESSQSSRSESYSSYPLGFDTDLLASVRRQTFRPPEGFTASQCCDRIRELLVSEQQEPFTLRTADLLILCNAVVSNQPDFLNIGMSRSEAVSLINTHVSKRHRLPNALSILQFVKFRVVSDSWNMRDHDMLSYSIDSLTNPRSIDMIDLARLLCLDNITTHSKLFPFIEHALRRSVTLDSAFNSPRTNAAALKFVEEIYSQKLTSNDSDLISLTIEVMTNRNCGSVSVLHPMIELAVNVSTDIPLKNRLTEGIRSQLLRWKSVKSLFDNDPKMKTRLREILSDSGRGRQVVSESQQTEPSVFPCDTEKIPDQVFTPDSRNPLGDWLVDRTSVSAENPVASGATEKSIEELNRRVFELEERIKQYEELVRLKQGGDDGAQEMHAFQLVPNKAKQFLTRIFESKVEPVPNLSSLSFDEFREHVLRRKKTELNRSVVARKLNFRN